MILPPLVRSAAPACLLQVLGDDFARLDAQAAGRVITDLPDVAHDEGFTDLYRACLGYARRIHPGSLTNYAGLLPPGRSQPGPDQEVPPRWLDRSATMTAPLRPSDGSATWPQGRTLPLPTPCTRPTRPSSWCAPPRGLAHDCGWSLPAGGCAATWSRTTATSATIAPACPPANPTLVTTAVGSSAGSGRCRTGRLSRA
jgi:hypothetical protein